MSTRALETRSATARDALSSITHAHRERLLPNEARRDAGGQRARTAGMRSGKGKKVAKCEAKLAFAYSVIILISEYCRISEPRVDRIRHVDAT